VVYKDDPRLWSQVALDWDRMFQEAAFDVNVRVQIVDTGFMINDEANEW